MAHCQETISSTASIEAGTVKYGELIVLGSSGFQPSGAETRRKCQFSLCQRPEANGVKPSTVHMGCNPQTAKAISVNNQHSISYTFSQDSTDVVEYAPDGNTDMFQIGRSCRANGPNDFVAVTDTVPDSQSVLNTISRYACHIICQRSPPHAAHIYAAGFDSSKNIFLGENAVKWKTRDGQVDGLTTNGVLVMHPPRDFTQDSDSNLWREISVCGNVFALRENSSPQKQGEKVDSAHFQELVDGSLIDLCGITLLWRTAEGLVRLPTTEHVRWELYAGRPWCQVAFNTLPFPSLRRAEMLDDKQPWAYLQCSHVHGYHGWKGRIEAQDDVGIVKDPQRDVCELTLDPNTAHTKMSLFENNKKVTRVEKDQKYPDHQDRFKDYGQVMCSEILTGRCYWEVEWSGGVEIAVTYKGINRQGDKSQFGYNGKSWSLRCNADDNTYTVWHNQKKTDLPVSPSSSGSGRVAVYVDWPAGTVSFYTVSSDTLEHLYTFQSKFTEALYAGFWVGWSDSSVRMCQREKIYRVSSLVKNTLKTLTGALLRPVQGVFDYASTSWHHST